MVRFAESLGNPDEILELFAQSRGLPASFLREHGLHICSDDGEKPGWLAIPYPHLTGYWYNRYRNLTGGSPKYWGEPGSSLHLYNPQKLGPNADFIVFTEGEMDCLVLTYLDFPAIGVPGAGGTSKFHSSWKLIFDGARVVVAFDGDEAGRGGASKLVEALSPHASVLDVPDGMDINDWFLADREELQDDVRVALYGRT